MAKVSAQDRRISPGTSGGGRRVALVIGNDAYPWGRLRNAVNDATSLAAVLPSLGFKQADITLITNANLKQLQRAGREFVERLRSDDLALVFYSGHGVEVHGENFLIPVDFPGDASELEVQDDAYSAQKFLGNLEGTQAKTRVVILDACRNNPLRASRAAGGGLAQMDGKGTLVVFSTTAGHPADDNGRGNNGLFTSYLLKSIATPGLTFREVMDRVARDVYRESNERQMPATYGVMLEDVVLVPGSTKVSNATPPENSASAEQEAWLVVKDSGNAAMLEQFIKEYPQSGYAGVARLKLASISSTASVSPRPSPPAPSQSSLANGDTQPPNGLPVTFRICDKIGTAVGCGTLLWKGHDYFFVGDDGKSARFTFDGMEAGQVKLTQKGPGAVSAKYTGTINGNGQGVGIVEMRVLLQKFAGTWNTSPLPGH